MTSQLHPVPVPETDFNLQMQLASLISIDLGTRMAAESALKDGDHETMTALIGVLADGAQPEEARWRAAIILGDLEAVDAVPALLAALGDESWEIRHSAVYALGHLCAPAGFDALYREVMNAFKAEQIPYVAGLGLMQVDVERGRTALEAAAQHENAAICSVARSVFAAVASRQI